MLPKWILPTLILVVDGLQQIKQLPDFIIPCANDPNLIECPGQLLEHLRNRLVRGIPDFQLPSIDPMLVPELTLIRRGSTIADYTANLTKILWTGAGDFKILKTFVDQDAPAFRIKLSFPYLHATSDLIAAGNLLNFEMANAGDFSCSCSNVVLDIVLNGQRYDRDGIGYLRWNKEDVGIQYDDFYFIHIHGLFDDPTVAHLFRAALNNGIRLIRTSISGFIVDTLGKFIIEAINRVHSLYPADVLYPNYR